MIGRHTYKNLGECIDKVINEFKLHNKVILIVTDNAANFIKLLGKKIVLCPLIKIDL